MYTSLRPFLIGLTVYYLLVTVLPEGSLTVEMRKGLLVGAISVVAAIASR